MIYQGFGKMLPRRWDSDYFCFGNRSFLHPMPTAVLSAPNRYSSYKKVDLTEYMPLFLMNGTSLDLNFLMEFLTIGYFSAEEQVKSSVLILPEIQMRFFWLILLWAMMGKKIAMVLRILFVKN